MQNRFNMENFNYSCLFLNGFVKETKTRKTEHCKIFLFKIDFPKIYLGNFECAEKKWTDISMLSVSNKTAHMWLKSTKIRRNYL